MLRKNLVIPHAIEKRLKRLSREIENKFWKQLDRLFKNPFYPSLRNKRVQAAENAWEFSITLNYRATYVIEGEKLIITNIGKHEDVF